jgi:hypothetical protein
MNQKATERALKRRASKAQSYQSLDADYHPFLTHTIMRSNAPVWEIFVASSCFVDSPRGWNGLSPSMPSLRDAILRIVDLMNYVGEESGATVSPVRTDNSHDVLLMPAVVSTFEVVPLNREATKPAGYRFRVLAQGQAGDAATILEKLFIANEEHANATRNKRTRQQMNDNETDAQKFIRGVTLEQYVRLCSIYTGVEFTTDQARAYPLTDRNNPVNPGVVFSLSESCRLAHGAEADDNYCIESNYLNRHGYTFFNPACVWRIRQCYLKPGNTQKLFWPNIVPASADPTDPHRLAYIRTHATGGITEKQAAFTYDQHVVRSSTVDEEPDNFDGLRAKHKRKRDKITWAFAAGRISEKMRDDMKDEADAQTLQEFGVLFSPTASQISIAAMATWVNEYAMLNESFCMPFEKLTSNLTRLGDELVQTMSALECLADVISEHKSAFGLFLKNLYLYSYSKMNINSIVTGPAGAGKSYMALLNMKLLIARTFLNSTYQSAKALAVPGDAYQFMIRFFEDVNPQMLGINGSSKAGETSNQDGESMLKAWLTSGIINAAVYNNPDNDRMNSEMVHVESKVHTSLVVISNASLPQIPHSIKDRGHCMQWHLKERVDGCNPLVKATKKPTQAQIYGLELLSARFRRNQAFIAIIFLLIYVGYFEEIDMSAATIIVSKALEEGKKSGLAKVMAIRHKERVDMLSRVLVLWDAISIIWDSPDSPLKGVPHDITHFGLVRRYLRCTVEHCTFALGLLSDQYESHITNGVVDNLKNTIFRSVTKKRKPAQSSAAAAPQVADQQQQQQSTDSLVQSTIGSSSVKASQRGMVHQDPNYLIAPFDDEQVGRGGRVYSDHDRIKYLAKAQLSTMNEKPLEADLVDAYQLLLDTNIPDVTHKPSSEYEQQRHVPCLKFEHGLIKLAKKSLTEAQPNMLLRCLKRVLDHEHATPCVYIYGATLPHCPFLFETITVGAPTRQRRMKIFNDEATYCEPMVSSITQGLLQSIHERVSASKGEDTSVYDPRAGSSSEPRVFIDIDFNDFADIEFFKRNKFFPDDVKELPEGNPIKRRDELILAAGKEGRTLIRYPFDIPQYNQIKYRQSIDRAVAADPERYRYSSIQAAAAAEAALVPALDSVEEEEGVIRTDASFRASQSMRSENASFLQPDMRFEIEGEA